MSWVRNLKCKYPESGGFQIDVPAWEIPDTGVTALWGASGAGKTSVFRLLLGLDRAEPGFSWKFGDEDLALLPTPARRLGVVFQSYELFPLMTARENILFAAEARGRAGADVDRHLKELVASLSLESCLNRRADLLSGGEKQRVALARALIGEPRVLFLDEPFSALDEALRVEARSLVARAIAASGIPTVLITHDRADLAAFGGKVSKIVDGRIVDP